MLIPDDPRLGRRPTASNFAGLDDAPIPPTTHTIMLNSSPRRDDRASSESMLFRASRDHDGWVAACSRRLATLRPGGSRESCEALAQAMWADVGHFDPEIAAEMEYESAFDD